MSFTYAQVRSLNDIESDACNYVRLFVNLLKMYMFSLTVMKQRQNILLPIQVLRHLVLM
ncbi:hypothetical protein [uncultured Catenibacterium sp.]|uniref:hypothetical protein n=1 Tax=uncultured Catenibacterium sp. TaxID=286142 RepID=UPI0025FFF948|nr:hypothetical protein [uncultured Catenibacterium sp.]